GTAFLAALAGNVTDEVWTKIKSDAAKKAIKQAIGAAIQRYATSDLRLDLARPLLEKDGFLTMPAVAGELTQLVRFEREPNAVLIGQQWKASMDDPPLWCDFTYEATRLLEYLRVELRSTEIFRPVFDAKSLDAIVVSAATSIESLTPVETQLADLAALADNRFSDLARTFAGSSLSLREEIRDYTRFIEEKTHDFVGREFVFDAVNHFTDTHSRGYFFIRGDPGVGKTALAAQMVRVNGYVHHFNIRSDGINTAELFLRNICAQLIVVYQLNYTSLPDEATQDGRFLSQLLEEVSGKLEVGEKAIIVIDALDQVDTSRSSLTSNPLYLPLTLPQGMYIIVTMRKVPLELRLECEHATLDIEHDAEANIADIHNYVENTAAQPGIQAYIATQGIDIKSFTELLVQKSEGNFMYLRYLLPEIEHGSFKDLSLGMLPTGLSNYYEDQWRRIRGRDEEDWFKYKLPIIMALTVVKEPISIDLIADFSGVRERMRIREVLYEWAPFLHEEQVIFEGSLQRRYHIYHASFQDFIAQKEEVEDERVSLRQAHKKIADRLWEELFGE
ncbi:MAG: hypothetical protein ACRDIV_25195, partial [Ktedonobacteraceae bacterium]